MKDNDFNLERHVNKEFTNVRSEVQNIYLHIQKSLNHLLLKIIIIMAVLGGGAGVIFNYCVTYPHQIAEEMQNSVRFYLKIHGKHKHAGAARVDHEHPECADHDHEH
jgi:hypothetical protein